jgi:2-methylcitrate dehydratase PrpD
MKTPVMDALVDIVLGLELASLPADVVAGAQRSMTDWVGTAIRGSVEPLADAIVKVIEQTGGEPQATIVARRRKASVLMAAMANGAQSHALDFDDTHLPSIVHASSPVAPVVLALGEWKHRSGADVLAAFIAGFEVETRIGRQIGRRMTERGWHVTGNLGHFGAAAAAGKLLGLNATQLANALGVAGTQAAGLTASFGTMAKPFHPGKAAMNGVLSAMLAREGFTGGTQVIDGPGGLPQTYLGVDDMSAAGEDLGKRWEILENSTKFYAACHLTHASVDAARALREQVAPVADAIESIRCRVYPLVMNVANQRDPQTDLEAKFSIAYCVASGLLRGNAGEADFGAAVLRDPALRRLIPRVTPEPDPSVGIGAAEVTITLKDGRVLQHRTTAARGTPGNPGTRDDLEEKFRGLAGVVLPAAQVETLVLALRRLPDVPDVAEIAALASGT